ncbi:uncharacterized protein AB675_3898 [Cyphellophora attinorum]|uniref:XLF-like coiled-coil region domain-containing protein n=1 Tax=Cyphellophora attinorum TaxID=1664694 RepID=A0A0N1H7K2_9EURO|nr:uncharacterized protein AB675_3898 [Phialophora attinorum]KPI37590.1 hypothetical protein AB675_3898 [Phialophora attinorum]
MPASNPSKADAAWHPLMLTNNASDVPLLYYNFSTHPASEKWRLTLYISDLTVLYSCKMHYTGITIEALRCSAQLPLSGLQGRDNVLVRCDDWHDGSRDAMDGCLKLRTTTALPSPLPELSFTFTLRPLSAGEFSDVLMRPLLQTLKAFKKNAEHLTQVIKDKDQVIQKLMDRVAMQVQGDFSVVFPVLNGKRAGDRGVKAAEKYVKGVAAFKDGGEGEDEDANGLDGLLSEVDGVDARIDRTSKPGKAGAWVEKMPRETGLEGEERIRVCPPGLPSPLRRAGDTERAAKTSAQRETNDTESEDEFERQPTPPSAKKLTSSVKQTSPAAQQGRRERQSSSDSEAEPPSKKRKSTPEASGARKGARLGGLGKNKWRMQAGARKNSSSPEPEHRRASNASTATASETEGEGNGSPPRTRATRQKSAEASDLRQEPDQLPPRKPARLGGLPKRHRDPGSLKQSTAINDNDSSSDDDAATSNAPGRKKHSSPAPSNPSKPTTPSRRLGRLHRSTASPSPRTNADRNIGGERSESASSEESTQTTPSKRKLSKLGALRNRRDPELTKERDKSADGSGSEDELDLDASPAPQKHNSSHAKASTAHEASDQEQPTENTGQKGDKQHDKIDHKAPGKQEEVETPERAAQRRREELKRRTAAAGSGSKKRRL